MDDDVPARPAPAQVHSSSGRREPASIALQYTIDPSAAPGDTLSALVDLLLSLSDAEEQTRGA
jgi:hypothetical protein